MNSSPPDDLGALVDARDLAAGGGCWGRPSFSMLAWRVALLASLGAYRDAPPRAAR